MSEKILNLSPEESRLLFGQQDRYLRRVRDECGVEIVAREDRIRIRGEEAGVAKAEAALEGLRRIARQTGDLSQGDVEEALGRPAARISADHRISTFQPGQQICPRTDGQAIYLDAVAKNDLVFCMGPAGTGKTYLAVASAVSQLKAGNVRRIILVRPAVEAGERLGFLPGGFQEKVDPYLRPLYDALFDMMDPRQMRQSMESGIIEVAPLAYMRGRNLDRSFILLDEAQNCTAKQMKMFLTRMGQGSKAIVTGDTTQIDLLGGEISGLVHVQRVLDGVPGVGFVRLTDVDVVRHRLVRDIVRAYADCEAKEFALPPETG
ncbi:MAG: PhoH family protein [Planctomycetota bacterium]